MSNWKIRPTEAMQSLVKGQIQGDDTFELMVTFKQEDDQWCITEIEGQKAPGYNSKTRRKEGGDVGAAYSAAMQPPPMAAGGMEGGDGSA